MRNIKSILLRSFAGISLCLSTLAVCLGQKITRLSHQKIILNNSKVTKILSIGDNYFATINNQLIHFKLKNDTINYSKIIHSEINDIILNSTKNQLVLLSKDSILRVNSANLDRVERVIQLKDLFQGEEIPKKKYFVMSDNELWISNDNNLYKKVLLTKQKSVQDTLSKKPMGSRETKKTKIKKEQEEIPVNQKKLDILSRKHTYYGSLENPITEGKKPVIKFSKMGSGFYILSTYDGKIYAIDEKINFANLQIDSSSSKVYDFYHDSENDIVWTIGADVRVFSWREKVELAKFDENSKPKFGSTEAKTICPIQNSTKVLVGTEGSGIYLIEYKKNDIEKKPIKTDTCSENFKKDNFDEDNSKLYKPDVNKLIAQIKSKIDPGRNKVLSIKIEGYASRTTEIDGSKEKTKEASQGRINFIKDELIKTFKFSKEIFEEINYGDENLLDENKPKDGRNRAVILTFKYLCIK